MASKKIRDIVVKVGEYTDRNSGEQKGRFENVGALMQSDEDDSYFIMLKRTFNPAGVPNQDARESILLSCYVPKDQREEQQPSQDRSGGDYGRASGGEGRKASPSQQASKTSYQAPYKQNDMDDEIPF